MARYTLMYSWLWIILAFYALDVIGAAVMIGRIATGEVQDNPVPADKAHHSAGGKKGGAARAAALTPKERSEIARKAAAKRWNKG